MSDQQENIVDDEQALVSLVDDEQALVEFVAELGSEGVDEGEGSFTVAGRQLVKTMAEDLLKRPSSWVLLLVQLANLWEAERLSFVFTEEHLTVTFTEVGDKRDWVKPVLKSLESGTLADDPEQATLQRALWAAMAQAQATLVIVAAGDTKSEHPLAVKFGLDSANWGTSEAKAKSFTLQILPAKPEAYLAEFQPAFEYELDTYSCSDATRVTYGREVKAFLPLSPRFDDDYKLADHSDEDSERAIALGIWALLAEKPEGIPLGKSFSKLDSSGMRRQELTFGVFRAGLIRTPGRENVQKYPYGDYVVTYTFHYRPTSSRIVCLWRGTEIAHYNLQLPKGLLVATVYVPMPDDLQWDLSGQNFRHEERFDTLFEGSAEAVMKTLTRMVTEFNEYRPKVGCSSLAFWTLSGVLSVGFAGLFSPLLGVRVAVFLGCVLAVCLAVAEFRGRHRTRRRIGSALQGLADVMSLRESEQPFWERQRLYPNGEKVSSELSL